MNVDYLIVGQGIGGSILTEHLINAGKRVKVIDDPSFSNSSKVAGGLYNPITGRKMVKTWNCDSLFEYLTPFYKTLEQKLALSFFHNTPIYRPFYSTEEYNEWMGKSADSYYEKYIRSINGESRYGQHLHDDYGGILLNESGYLDTKKFVLGYRTFLKNSDLLIEDAFDYTQMNVSDSGVYYKGIQAGKIIFSEGRLQSDNPYFNWLPLKPVKGELIWIKSKEKIDVIYNRGVFLIPLGNGVCKVGATYHHEKLDELVTEKGQNELVRRLRKLIHFDYEVIDQKAGVRPATIDRKPFIGRHPKHKNVIAFNGLGAKGVSLAPYYANQIVRHLESNAELDAEVNIERFFSLF